MFQLATFGRCEACEQETSEPLFWVAKLREWRCPMCVERWHRVAATARNVQHE